MKESEKLQMLLDEQRERKANGGKTLKEIELEIPFINQIFGNFKNVEDFTNLQKNKIDEVLKDSRFSSQYKNEQVEILNNEIKQYYKDVIDRAKLQNKYEREKREIARSPKELTINEQILNQLELNNKLQVLNNLRTDTALVNFTKSNIDNEIIRNIVKDKYTENLEVSKMITEKEEAINNIDADLNDIDYKLKVLEANENSLCTGLTETDEINFINI